MKFPRKIVDAHWHAYSWLDANGEDFYTVIDRYQENLGLAGMNLSSIPTSEDLGPTQNVLPLLYKLHNPTAYAYGGIVYTDKPVSFPQPEGFNVKQQYEELMEMGFDGIKMLEAKPSEQKAYQMRVTDPWYEDLFAACEKDGTPMLWHVADPPFFWDIEKIPQRYIDRGWYYGDGTHLSSEEMYGMAYEILERHPNLKVTFAHFFFLSERPERLEALFEKYPNVCIDLAPAGEMYSGFNANLEFYKNFFEKYSERIIFGSDASFSEHDGYNHYTKIITQIYNFLATDTPVEVYGHKCPAIHISEKAADNVFYKNFQRRTGEAPRPVNKAALKRYVEKYKPYCPDQKLLELIENAVKDF